MWIEYYKSVFKCTDIKFGEFCIENQDYILCCYGIKSHNFFLDENLFQYSDSFINHEFWKTLFRNGYFVVLFDKKKKHCYCWRDVSGIKTGYYYFKENHLIISTNVHNIAKRTHSKLSKMGVDSFVYNYYLLDGLTLYSEIFEVKIGEKCFFNLGLQQMIVEDHPRPIIYEENTLNENENILELRNRTLETFENIVDNNNIVYLSGGIDSCVILAALNIIVPNNTYCISYKVKGGACDETYYAKIAADYLSKPLEIIEFDPNDRTLASEFEEVVLNNNIPYEGMFMYRPHKMFSEESFFAGQDTRIHTPTVDALTFNAMNKIFNQSLSLNIDNDFIIHFLVETHKRGINLSKVIPFLCNNKSVINYLLFPVSASKFARYDFNVRYLKDFKAQFRIRFNHTDSMRNIYNDMILKKWTVEYVRDIRYMVDLGNGRGCNILLPFFEPYLIKFQSSIPWKYLTKMTIGTEQYSDKSMMVDKYILRKAFEKEISEKVLYRAKATSEDVRLMYHGTLRKIFLQVLESDFNSQHSFLKEFDFADYYEKHINKQTQWTYRECKSALYLACCVVYFNNSNK